MFFGYYIASNIVRPEWQIHAANWEAESQLQNDD